MTRFTLKDRLVKEAFRGIIKANSTTPESRIILVGGMACQVYSPSPELYRSTSDIDVVSTVQLTNEEFKENLGRGIANHLKELGYQANLTQSRFGHELRSREENDLFFIHLSRFTKAYLERHSHWKVREFDNAQLVELPQVGVPMLVYRIEDIFANKARRIRRLKQEGYVEGERDSEFNKFLKEDFEALASLPLDKRLEEANQAKIKILGIGKDEVQQREGQLTDYKAVKDLYDIALLSRAVVEGAPLDKEYLRNALFFIR